jgi:hypothetical protein
MRLALGAALLWTSPAAPLAAQYPGNSALSIDTHADDPDEIVVHGRRSDQHRIPLELRVLPPERSERWRKATNRDLSCQHVGPRGCGTPVMPIVTIGADGKVRIGAKDSSE